MASEAYTMAKIYCTKSYDFSSCHARVTIRDIDSSLTIDVMIT